LQLLLNVPLDECTLDDEAILFIENEPFAVLEFDCEELLLQLEKCQATTFNFLGSIVEVCSEGARRYFAKRGNSISVGHNSLLEAIGNVLLQLDFYSGWACNQLAIYCPELDWNVAAVTFQNESEVFAGGEAATSSNLDLVWLKAGRRRP